MNALGAKRQYQNSNHTRHTFHHRSFRKYRNFSLRADSYVHQKFISIEFPDKRQYQLNASLIASIWAMSQSRDVVPGMREEIFWYSYNHCYGDNASLLKIFDELDGEFLIKNARPLNTSDFIDTVDLEHIHECRISIVNIKKYPHMERIIHLETIAASGVPSSQEFYLDDECPEYLSEYPQESTEMGCSTEAS